MQALRLRVFFGLYFPKIDFLPIKKLYFPFLYLSSQFVIWLGHKPTLGLKISGSLGNRGARVKRGTKCGVYRCPSFDLWALLTESKESETKHFVLMYGSGPTYTYSTQHAYMGQGATLQSHVRFVYPNSHPCCLRNEQWQVHYPRTCFFDCKQKANDSLS